MDFSAIKTNYIPAKRYRLLMSLYLYSMLKALNILLYVVIASMGGTVFAEERLPVKLKFTEINRQEVSALLNNQSVPKIITLTWNEASEKFLSRPPGGRIATYDLNDDGIEELFLYTSGYGMCGSGGCHLIIFQFNKKNKIFEYKTVSSSSDDILILNSLTGGYHNLAIRLMDGTSMTKAQEYTLYLWKENGDLVQTDETMIFQ